MESANFENGDSIDFSMYQFNIVRLYDAREFIIYNRHAVLSEFGVEADTDADGLSDVQEDNRLSDPLRRDTDEDGLGDGFEVAMGQRPTHMDYYCAGKSLDDSDGDGINDCEELVRNYDASRFDTDVDLFPDRLELFSGTNPADGDDVRFDMDYDGVKNQDELRARTNPRIAEEQQLYAEYAYRVSHERIEIWNDNYQLERICYGFHAENISLVHTIDGRPNEIVLEFVETPEDDANNEYTLQRHVVQVNPNAGSFTESISMDIGNPEFVVISTMNIGLSDEDDEETE